MVPVAPPVLASPTLITTASPALIALSDTTPPTLTDSAVLAGGNSPTGTITFDLTYNNTIVYTDVVTVNGNGTYNVGAGNHPGGYPLPSAGAAAGLYTWTATYSGDLNNNTANDQGGPNEQETVFQAGPTITTTPSPSTVALNNAGVPVLKDTAILAGGYLPTGTITFTLFQGGTLVDTESVGVAGNGSYQTPVGYTLPTIGTQTGAYQWNASYSGDTNNAAAVETGNAAEQVIVNKAGPTLLTTAGFSADELAGSALPQDQAVLTGGFQPTGSITFTLRAPDGTTVDTETVNVTGNGAYATANAVAATQVGTYTWAASYTGDGNNGPANDQGGPAEQVMTTLPAPSVDVGIEASVSVSSAPVGSTVTYTYMVCNYGPSTALNVSASGLVPAGEAFVTAGIPTQGTFNAQTGVWEIGTLPNGMCVAETVTMALTSPGTITSTSTTTSSTPDTNLANNSATVSVSGTMLSPAEISKRDILSSTATPPAPTQFLFVGPVTATASAMAMDTAALVDTGTPPPGATTAGAGFAELAAYRPSTGSWSLDSNGSFGFQASDRVIPGFSPAGANVVPVSGDWAGIGTDEIGDFEDGTWHLDLNNNGTLESGETFVFGMAGDVPVPGHYLPGGGIELAVFRSLPSGAGEFIISDANWLAEARAGQPIRVSESFLYGAAGDHVVVGDWNGQGLTEVGVYRPGAALGAPGANVFTLDVANHHTFDSSNKVFFFGATTDGVVIGDWNGSGTDKVGVYRPATAFGAPNTTIFTLDETGDFQFDANSAVFLFGTPTDKYVAGQWAYTTSTRGQADAGLASALLAAPGQSGLSALDTLFASQGPAT